MGDDLRYPIGKFVPPPQYQALQVTGHLKVLGDLPEKIGNAVSGLAEEQLDTPYREGGWTVRQVVHHVADSHLNSYIRGRMALTVEQPRILPYDEKLWAEFVDAREAPIAHSLQLLGGLHARWVMLWSGLDSAAWNRTMVHPDFTKPISLWWLAALYDWHSRHHVAHITSMRQRQGW